MVYFISSFKESQGMKGGREGSRQMTQTNERGSALLSAGAQMKIYPPVSGIAQPALLHFTCLK